MANNAPSDADFDAAIAIALRHSGFTSFAPEYPPLFKRLWNEHRGGNVHLPLANVEAFISSMVNHGWGDWRENMVLLPKLEPFRETGVPLAAFAEWSENNAFDGEAAFRAAFGSAVITPAHRDWKRQGGDDPSGPALPGHADIAIVDWSKPREEVKAAVAAALKRDGFFCLVNHPVPHTSVSRTLNNAREFFARTRFAKEEELRQIRVLEATRPMMKCARGYSDTFSEALNPEQGPDNKECFDFSLPARPGRPPCSTMVLGDNMWPSEQPLSLPPGALDVDAQPEPETMRPSARKGVHKKKRMAQPFVPPPDIQRSMAPAGFRDGCETYLDATFALANELLVLILEAVVPPDIVARDVLPLFEDPLVVSRLIRYPATTHLHTPAFATLGARNTFGAPPGRRMVPDPPAAGMGAGSHVDYGALTLIAEDCLGLEVQRRGDTKEPWRMIQHVEGSFVVNTGYVLEKLTNGKI